VEALGELGAEVEVGAAGRDLLLALALSLLAAQLRLRLLVGILGVGVYPAAASASPRRFASRSVRSLAACSIRSGWARQRSAMNSGSQMNAWPP
jgi:hypothetical protein